MDDEVSKATEILFLGIVEELRALQLPINGGRIALGVGFHFQAGCLAADARPITCRNRDGRPRSATSSCSPSRCWRAAPYEIPVWTRCLGWD